MYVTGKLVRDVEQRSLMPYKRRTVEQLSDSEIRKTLCVPEPECASCEMYRYCRYGQEYERRRVVNDDRG